MRYYLGNIKEHHGEYVCDQTILFTAESMPDEVLASITKSWYGSSPEPENDGYGEVYWGDGMCWQAGSFYEIKKEVFTYLSTNTNLNCMN